MNDDFDMEVDRSSAESPLGFHQLDLGQSDTPADFNRYFDKSEHKSWQQPISATARGTPGALETYLGLKIIRRPALYWHTKAYSEHVQQARAARLQFKKDVVDAVRAGLVLSSFEFAEEIDQDSIFDLPDEHLNLFVERKVRSAFHSIADSYLADQDLSPLIGTEAGFEQNVTLTIRKRFEIPIDMDEAFFDGLYWAVWNFVVSGGRIGGDWGQIVPKNKRLYMKIWPEEAVSFVDTPEITLEFE